MMLPVYVQEIAKRYLKKHVVQAQYGMYKKYYTSKHALKLVSSLPLLSLN